MIIYTCDFKASHEYTLSGPGIDGFKKARLPIEQNLIKQIMQNNATFALGNEILFLDTTSGEMMALSRTTKVE
ncbi:phosphonate C-P lyase system protein PhnH [Campylobacter suis]|uniref:DUF306 domain-containing protein n=1 Tax=Campylobacter suis TaxID=2790657 RepID=A0ABM8Q8M7_9BACT|nr:phosphonate C-P lyase system protein PhnH [Campylobacter suis]CAD7289331.1 hypothetical protein LMG8286_01761 [Campylobacter suis]